MTRPLEGQLLRRDAAGQWAASPGAVTIADGRIAEVRAGTGSGAAGGLVMPALSNAHDHGRGLRTIAFGAGDDALEVWLAALGLEPATDAWLRAAVPFARMAQAGVAALNHCHNSADPKALVAEAEAVSRAARDVGIRVAFAVPVMGRNPIAYGDPAPLLSRLPAGQAAALANRRAGLPDQRAQLAMVEEIAGFENECFSVQYGPVGPQWVDDEILEAIAQGSADTGRRVHMHLFETRFQTEWAAAAYPGGLVRHLDAIGFLSPRLTLAHGVHLDDADCALLAERGVHISLNSSSNLRLRSGIAPVARFLQHGLRFGLGLDGMAFDDDEDALRELRVAWRLQRGWGVDEVLSRDRLLDAALIDGRRAVFGPDGAGQVEPGAPADLLELDCTRITADVIDGRTDLVDMVLARARNEDVRRLVVGGRTVVEDGRATGIDLPEAEAELIARARAAAGPAAPDAAALQAAIADYYRCGCHRQPAAEEV